MDTEIMQEILIITGGSKGIGRTIMRGEGVGSTQPLRRQRAASELMLFRVTDHDPAGHAHGLPVASRATDGELVSRARSNSGPDRGRHQRAEGEGQVAQRCLFFAR